MPEKVLRLIFILLFTVLGVVLSRQGESVLTALLPSSVLTETILGITFMSLATMLLGGILGAVVGCAVSPYLISRLFALTSRMEKSLSAMSTQDLIARALSGAHHCKSGRTCFQLSAVHRAVCFCRTVHRARIPGNASRSQQEAGDGRLV